MGVDDQSNAGEGAGGEKGRIIARTDREGDLMYGMVARAQMKPENREKLIEVLTNEPEWSDGEWIEGATGNA